jgi:hypothetical protein
VRKNFAHLKQVEVFGKGKACQHQMMRKVAERKAAGMAQSTMEKKKQLLKVEKMLGKEFQSRKKTRE